MKKTYRSPFIEEIVLDKEISLQLQSNPTVNPGEIEMMNQSQSASMQDPYQYDGW